MLPNLRNATVSEPQNCHDRKAYYISRLLLCPTLRGFAFLSAEPERSIMKRKMIYPLRELFRDIVEHAENLTFFKLTVKGGLDLDENRTLEDGVQWLVRRLPKLRIINASPSVLTSKVMETLSMNKELCTVVATPARRDRHDLVPSLSIAPDSDFYPYFVHDAGSFPNLTRHTLISSVQGAMGILNQPNFPSRRLTELTLLATGGCKHSDRGDDDPDASVHAFIDNALKMRLFETVASTCPQLQRLDIDLDGSYAWPGEQFNYTPMNHDSLQGFQELSSLRELYLRNKSGVALTEIKLIDLATYLPCLEVLYICPEPHSAPEGAHHHASLLGRSAIDRVVETLSELRVLGLFITTFDEYKDRILRSGHAQLDLLYLGHSIPPPDSYPPDAFVKYFSAKGRLAVGPRGKDRWGQMGEGITEELDDRQTGWSRMIGYLRYTDELTMNTPDLASYH